jgi:uncharacterized membrane protein
LTIRKSFLALAAVFYVGAGVLHFVKPEAYLQIMPPYIPWPLAMIYISGLAEIAGGIGLAIPRLRRAAAWGLVALLFAIFPANLYMAMHHIQVTVKPVSEAVLWARLPLQIVLIGWVLWCSGALRPPVAAAKAERSLFKTKAV